MTLEGFLVDGIDREGGQAGTVIITGGSSGLGRCTAALFASKGWHVGLIARGAAGLEAAAADVVRAGGRAAFAVADVTCGEALGKAAQAIVAELGSPDVWINCAGNGVYGRFSTVPEAEFDHVTAVTYGGTVNGCRVALALMRQRGSGTIVNVCSAIAYHGMPLMASYAGAKAAVRGFGQSLRAELRIERSAIKLCAVFPPAVNTPFFSHAKSYMGWPARPAPPVYQPEVVAAGIYLAARTGAAETVVSGTVAAFSLVSRISPRLIAWAMTRLGFEGAVDPGSGGITAGGADLVRALGRRLAGARAVQQQGAEAERAPLAQRPCSQNLRRLPDPRCQRRIQGPRIWGHGLALLDVGAGHAGEGRR